MADRFHFRKRLKIKGGFTNFANYNLAAALSPHMRSFDERDHPDWKSVLRENPNDPPRPYYPPGQRALPNRTTTRRSLLRFRAFAYSRRIFPTRTPTSRISCANAATSRAALEHITPKALRPHLIAASALQSRRLAWCGCESDSAHRLNSNHVSTRSGIPTPRFAAARSFLAESNCFLKLPYRAPDARRPVGLFSTRDRDVSVDLAWVERALAVDDQRCGPPLRRSAAGRIEQLRANL